MSSIATFHLLKWRGIAGMITALAFDRIRYRRTPSLVFLRVLGTGKADSTAPSTQVGRTALFCVFDDEGAADRFIERVKTRRGLVESWHVKLHGAGGHGAWRGLEIPKLLGAPTQHGDPRSPLAMITRADVRPGSWRTFARAARVVDRELHMSDGLVAVVGIGEAPILRLGTFSIWRDRQAMVDFSRRQPEHQRVVERTRRDRWYGEEMFARFVPYWSTGTWDGRDPLRSVSDGKSMP